VKLGQFLIPMQRHIGGVDVEDEFVRRSRLRGDELFNEHPIQSHHIGAGGSGLQAGERGAAGQGCHLAHRRLQQRIVPQPVMMVEILIPATQTIKPLGYQVVQGMRDAVRVPGITQRLCHRLR
jgi:hypothetical protein